VTRDSTYREQWTAYRDDIGKDIKKRAEMTGKQCK